MRRLLPVLLAGAVLMPSAAGAAWTARAAGPITAPALTLTNATGLRLSCAVVKGGVVLTLGWTPTPDDFAGYAITRTGSGGGTSGSLTVSSSSTTSVADSVPSGPGFTYAYTIRVTSGLWRTAPSPAVSITLPAKNTCPAA